MILREEKYELDGKEILLRSANENADDANMLIDYLKTVTGETLEILLRKIKEQGYEQAELTVVEGNDRTYHLYESLGFKECGRVPNANKYDDGTYSDDILMVLSLRDEGRNENLA